MHRKSPEGPLATLHPMDQTLVGLGEDEISIEIICLEAVKRRRCTPLPAKHLEVGSDDRRPCASDSKIDSVESKESY